MKSLPNSLITMPTTIDKQTKSEKIVQKNADEAAQISHAPPRTVIGWQGIRFTLPPEWNLTGFSMDRDNGYLRVDSPGNGTITVQVRWSKPDKPPSVGTSLYAMTLAPLLQRFSKKPLAMTGTPDLKANLEKMFLETAKQSKKAKTPFESHIKPEKTEGPDGERTAMNFSWTGEGRGQGKIWSCSRCKRVVIAQVVGLARDQSAISAIASQLFSTLHDHAEDGLDLWALYDLQVKVPEDFLLEEQKLLSGYLSLTFGRKGEKIFVDRWGLAKMTLKKFTTEEWFQNNAQVSLKKLKKDVVETSSTHEVSRFSGPLSIFSRIKILKDAKNSLRRFPSKYEGGVWVCEESNKIFSLQVMSSKLSKEVFTTTLDHIHCHSIGEQK